MGLIRRPIAKTKTADMTAEITEKNHDHWALGLSQKATAGMISAIACFPHNDYLWWAYRTMKTWKPCKGPMCPFKMHPSGMFIHHCCGRCALATQGRFPGRRPICFMKFTKAALGRKKAAAAALKLQEDVTTK